MVGMYSSRKRGAQRAPRRPFSSPADAGYRSLGLARKASLSDVLGWRAGHRKEDDMPKLSERERLADLEARQRKAAEDVENARRALRGKYASIVSDLPVEGLTEREFRDVLVGAIRVGGAPSIAALKALPAVKT